MIMVVFGAGASYDSNPYKPARGSLFDEARMPLANELFSDRKTFREVLDRFPDCKPLVPRLLPHGINFSIERELQVLFDEASHDPKRHQQLAAVRYYLHTMINSCQAEWLKGATGSTNHMALLDYLRRKENRGICLVTFNYDTIIEHALPSVGVVVDGLPAYVSNDCYKLIKLHGSVDWAHVITSGPELPRGIARTQGRQWIIDNINRLVINYSEFEIINEFPMSFAERNSLTVFPNGLTETRPRQVGFFPAIAVPVENKNAFECPSEHVQVLESCLPKVEQLIIVGWRATEKPFLKLLAERLGRHGGQVKCVVVGEKHESTRATVANLESAGVKANFSHYVAGFTAFVSSREVVEFLAE